MQLGFDLSQRQTIKLAITPEIKQSINILQYSSIELIDFLNEQAMENPLIDLTEAQSDCSIAPIKLPDNPNHSLSYKSTTDEKVRKNTAKNENYDFLDHYCGHTLTLEEHLWEQIAFLNNTTKEQQMILRFLIGSLDTNGYLELSNKEISSLLQKPLSLIEETVTFLQSLLPRGIGARNLSECLLLQIQERFFLRLWL